ncbi:MAG: AAA family ATPase [Sorangiineae bacterium]|nr:AAA family ATPase [Polyangiaceae bacterium]MEB2324616.1 AAA family ATPase [Sorangiineae bacterium]
MTAREGTAPGAPLSLAGMQVDVTTRMGDLTPATPTGLPILDGMLAGGLRSGTMMSVSGAPGVGKTAFVLTLAYMAARARAAVLFTSVSLDETEVMARLAARALHREYPASLTPYGAIWSGQAWKDETTRRPVGSAVETVVKKVGANLHLHKARPFASSAELAALVGHLWERHERVVLVVDGIQAFRAAAGGSAAESAIVNASYAGRVSQLAYELRQLAEAGCAVLVSAQDRDRELVSPAATLSAELRVIEGTLASPIAERQLALGARALELRVEKNALGPTGIVPLRFIAGAATFEERAP